MLAVADCSRCCCVPDVIDGPSGGPAVLAYIDQVLLPTFDKKDVVFMEDLRGHNVDVVVSVRRRTRPISADRNDVFEP
jgi:hypothetical protein